MLKANLVYLNDNKYHISTFGTYIINYLNLINQFSKLRAYFGKIDPNLLPFEIIKELDSILEGKLGYCLFQGLK
ncbi:MAG: hypothetical protein KGD63_00820 [Candidatus Lokiarchaeota archaeon]|nr:hypothetical protein [Candidatus Lokiarchaeota archaeon]